MLDGDFIGALGQESTATTMQTMATATMTPIGTTTLKRARSQLVYFSSDARGRATAGEVEPLLTCPTDSVRAEPREESLLLAFVTAPAASIPQFWRCC